MKPLKILVLSCLLSLATAAHAQDSVMKSIASSMSKNEAASGLAEKMNTLATKFQSLAVSEGIIAQPEACQTVCSVSCSWVDGRCVPVTTCSLQCSF